MTQEASLDFIPAEQLRPAEWDMQWLQDFRQWYGPMYFHHHDELGLIADLRGKQPAELYSLQLCSEQLPLWTWVPGDALVGRSVLEIGCGPGLFGKQVGKIAERYLGIDQSPLAVSIARRLSPDNCTYLSVTETEAILAERGRYDTMVGRFFFIHQNFRNALWVMRLAHLLLADGGVVWADFYSSREPDYQPRCTEEAAGRHVTSGYMWTDDDVRRLASETGFAVETCEDRSDILRRFASLRKA